MPLEEAEEALAVTSLNEAQSGAGQVSPNFELSQPGGETRGISQAEVKPVQKEPVQPEPTRPERTQPEATQPEATQPEETQPVPVQPANERPLTAVSDSEQAANSASRASMPRAIAVAPQAVWYVRPPSGGQFGPADGNLFFQWMKENRVARDALVWRDGWPQWMSAAEAFEESYGPKWLADPDPLPSVKESVNLADGTGAIASQTVGSGNEAIRIGDAVDEVLPSASSPSASSPTAGLPAESLPVERLPAAGLPAAGLPAAGLPIRREPLSAARRKRIRNNYGIGIAVLAILAIILVTVLIFVLTAK